MTHLAALPSVLPMADCIPTNDLLYGPLGPVITKLTGAFGGLFLPTAIMMIVLLGILILAFVLSKRGSQFMKAVAGVIAVVLGLPLVILIIASMYTMLNSTC